MSSSKAGIEGQDPLTTIAGEILEVKEKIGKLEQKIESFENDKSPKDETRLTLMYSQLDTLEKRLAGLEDDRRKASALPQPQQAQVVPISSGLTRTLPVVRQRATFAQVFGDPETVPRCSVVRFNIFGGPKNIRHRFANRLLELSESTGIFFGGYVMRRVNEYVEVVIVVKSCKEDDIGELYFMLRNFKVVQQSFNFEEINYTEAHRLDRRFTVIRQGQEPENFSNDLEEVRYEVASSIHSHSSSRL